MQRRAAAVYFAFFLVVASAASLYIGYAQANQQPEFTVEGPTLAANGSTTIDDTRYTVGAIGSAGGGELEATLTWTNASARMTATIQNGSTFTYENTTFTVVVPQDGNATAFTLRETFDVSSVLAADEAVEDETVTVNGTEQVVYRENDTVQPLPEYLPEPRTVTVENGSTIPYEGNDATVADVSPSAVTLAWTGSAEREVDLTEGGNVTLAGGDRYFAHFQSDEHVTLVPIEQHDTYTTTVAERNYFHERMNGLWGIVILCIVGGIVLLSTAYLPVRG